MVDVIVVGAGPAGIATAALLRRFGYDVEIWEREQFPRHRIGESLPPRAVAVLQHLGFKPDGFAVMNGHTSIWGSPQPRRAVFQDGYGLQVERDRFDNMLLAQSGVKVHFGRSVRSLLREDGRVVGVRYVEGDVHSRFVVIASGPANDIRHLRQTALFGYWRGSRHPEGSQANDTIIESFADGWVWSLRLESDLRNVTVLFDKPGVRYDSAIAATSFVRRMLDGATLITKPEGCDASWQCTASFAEPGMLRVGDAGSVIDPLSSQGVYKALCSAMSAAVVVNTCLDKPQLEAAALDFFNREERRTYDGYSAGCVATFRSEQRWPEQPFWKTRHELSAWDIPQRPFSPQIAQQIESANAFDLKIRNADEATVAQRASISGRFIELADYVVSAAFDYGYRGPHAQAMLQIHQNLASPKTIRELLTALGSYETSTLLRVLAYMYREGLVETA